MTTLAIDIRKAEPRDAEAIANVHHEAWLGAYAGIIPHRALTAMINRRGAEWWANAIRRAATVLVVEIGGKVAGYATIGRNRARELPQQGEIYELYLRPEYQGIGLGSRLFAAARERLEVARAEGPGGLGAGGERRTRWPSTRAPAAATSPKASRCSTRRRSEKGRLRLGLILFEHSGHRASIRPRIARRLL